MSRPARRNRPGGATIEIRRRGTRDGIVVEVDQSSQHVLRMMLEDAFDVAGSRADRRVTDPGWWAAHVAAAAVNRGYVVGVQRIPSRLEPHVTIDVEPGRLAALHPPWPLVQFRTMGEWMDLRGETALRHGPSDLELEAYRSLYGACTPDVNELRRMFELGVLEWEGGAMMRGGRRKVVHAQADRS